MNEQEVRLCSVVRKLSCTPLVNSCYYGLRGLKDGRLMLAKKYVVGCMEKDGEC